MSQSPQEQFETLLQALREGEGGQDERALTIAKLQALPRGNRHPILCNCKLCQGCRTGNNIKNPIFSIRLEPRLKVWADKNRKRLKAWIISEAEKA